MEVTTKQSVCLVIFFFHSEKDKKQKQKKNAKIDRNALCF